MLSTHSKFEAATFQKDNLPTRLEVPRKAREILARHSGPTGIRQENRELHWGGFVLRWSQGLGSEFRNRGVGVGTGQGLREQAACSCQEEGSGADSVALLETLLHES